MADSTTKPASNRRGLGATAQKPQNNATVQGQAGVTGRSAYQQRIDEMKVRIVDLSHRNMESAIRIMRTWMQDV